MLLRQVHLVQGCLWFVFELIIDFLLALEGAKSQVLRQLANISPLHFEIIENIREG